MMIDPSEITEDPLSALPAATRATDFLRQMEPQLLSSETLSQIIQDRRLNLYPKERATKPMDQVVRGMLTNDLRIEALKPALGTRGVGSAFSISFSYPDRYKAQLTVQSLLNAIQRLNVENTLSKSNASKSVILRAIAERKAGEMVDVLDTASLPVSPVNPNRLLIAAVGLIAGLLLGIAALKLPRPRFRTTAN